MTKSAKSHVMFSYAKLIFEMTVVVGVTAFVYLLFSSSEETMNVKETTYLILCTGAPILMLSAYIMFRKSDIREELKRLKTIKLYSKGDYSLLIDILLVTDAREGVFPMLSHKGLVGLLRALMYNDEDALCKAWKVVNSREYDEVIKFYGVMDRMPRKEMDMVYNTLKHDIHHVTEEVSQIFADYLDDTNFEQAESILGKYN